jgi:hypothetical protein
MNPRAGISILRFYQRRGIFGKCTSAGEPYRASSPSTWGASGAAGPEKQRGRWWS